uniref:Uncharacterized protein n=1 Tax=Nelumbo nucifera TaxID=4432 RepID=A0A822XPY7_NELNU|nr:TPA_asm: hypothetical protein HUJ06_025127 [Nelumbo nucifera]
MKLNTERPRISDDKWRNIFFMANGWGSKEAKAWLAFKRSQQIPIPKHGHNPMALNTMVQKDEEIVDVKPLAIFCADTLKIAGLKKIHHKCWAILY